MTQETGEGLALVRRRGLMDQALKRVDAMRVAMPAMKRMVPM